MSLFIDIDGKLNGPEITPALLMHVAELRAENARLREALEEAGYALFDADLTGIGSPYDKVCLALEPYDPNAERAAPQDATT